MDAEAVGRRILVLLEEAPPGPLLVDLRCIVAPSSCEPDGSAETLAGDSFAGEAAPSGVEEA